MIGWTLIAVAVLSMDDVDKKLNAALSQSASCRKSGC